MKEKIVCVEWDDASFNYGYYDKKDKEKFQPMKTKTAGFLVKSDRKCIIISHDRFYDEKGKIDDERHITTVPRAMVRAICYLEAIDGNNRRDDKKKA